MRLTLLALVLSGTVLAAEPAPASFVENVAARNDPTQTYTLQVPPSCSATVKCPLLFVFDPRGRGTIAAEIFRPGAEAHGWILISSNQTRSDDDGSANARAIRALLPEIARYPANPRRIYATGFSGTAIFASAVGLNSELAGVIAVGGRLVPEVSPAKFAFAHYGFAGDTDFNNREMRLIDAQLDAGKTVHRFQQFPGDHRWIRAELASEAISWLELVAMKEARRTPSEAFINEEYAKDVAAAEAWLAAGKRVEALRRYREIVATFAGLHATETAQQAVARLERDAAVQRDVKDLSRWDEFEARHTREVFGQIGNLFARVRQQQAPPTTAMLARELGVPDLRRRAKKDDYEGLASRRLLESLYAQTSFYLLNQLMARREYALAAAVVGVATLIHDDRWPAWYNLAAAYARAGDRRSALDALDKAVSLGLENRGQLNTDEDFSSLRDEPRFRAILASPSQ